MPENEKHARLLAECIVRRSRGSGPGGQHRNVTESRIELVHQPSGIRVVCDDTRSQHRNLERALERMAHKLEVAARVEKPRVLRTRRLKRVQRTIMEDKKRRSNLKRLRRRPEKG